jgi:hypothetical protein
VHFRYFSTVLAIFCVSTIQTEKYRFAWPIDTDLQSNTPHLRCIQSRNAMHPLRERASDDSCRKPLVVVTCGPAYRPAPTHPGNAVHSAEMSAQLVDHVNHKSALFECLRFVMVATENVYESLRIVDICIWRYPNDTHCGCRCVLGSYQPGAFKSPNFS